MFAEATTLITLLGLGALVTGVLVARLPVATCAECPHCRAAAMRSAAEQRRLREEYARRAGVPPRLWDRPDDGRDRNDGDRL